MIQLRGTVTYTDGTEDAFTGGINALSMWETYAQRTKLDSNPEKSPMTWTLYVAFACLDGKLGDTGFDTWRKKVEHVDLEADDANPTQPAAQDA
jgi:hypothetical protein